MSKNFVVSDEELENLIHNYCNDFTELERMGRYDPITGRDDEIDQVVLILLQKGRKNACFLAPAGVGKTAAVVGLSQAIVRGDVPEYLKSARVLEIDMAKMAAGTESNAEFQGRFIPFVRALPSVTMMKAIRKSSCSLTRSIPSCPPVKAVPMPVCRRS